MTILRFISTIIAITLLTAIIIGLGIVIMNIHLNTSIIYTLITCCFIAGIAGAITELLESY